MNEELKNILVSIPTLGSVRERLSYFACKTEAGELNTTLNRAMVYIEALEKSRYRWMTIAGNMTALPDTDEWFEAIREYEQAVRDESHP